MKRIILTGGGTAGHVTPNIALLPRLKELNYDIHYIGSYNGIEKELIEQFGIPYHGISTGKLRRYFSVQNFTDPFRVIKGLGEAKKLVKILHPDVIFSKGGFVSVPVVLAGKSRHVPTIIHESDMTPGLANKISMPSASKICCNFPETIEHLPAGKAVLTGSPIRQELLSGDKYKALEFLHFTQDKPVIMVVGGSLGSVAVNDAVRSVLPELLQSFQVVHLCGKGKVDESLKGLQGYAQFEYIKDELKDLFALTDLVISRAGANAICELLALHKPNLLIPLSANASRGDQILNARSFERQGYSVVLEEEELNHDVLLDAIMNLYQNRETYIQAMKNSPQQNSIDTIIDLIEAAAGLLDNMDPESRIKAEAEEETGFKVSSVQKIFEAYMSPGSVTEKLYFYLAEYQPKDKTSAGGGIKAEGEDIDVLELPFEDALRGIETGMIVDGKTIMLLYHVALKGIL